MGQHFKQFYYRQLKNEQLDEVSAKVSEMWTKCVFTSYVNHIEKSDISLVLISPGSADTNVWWGGKLNGLLMTSCVRNICTKNYQNLIIGFKVTVENVRDVFWDTVQWDVVSHDCKTGQKVRFSVCCGKLATTDTTKLTPANCSRPMQQLLERCGRQR